MDNDDESSSDSSIDDHFKSPDKINFNSPFFNTHNLKKSNNINNNKASRNIINDEEQSISDNSDSDDDDFISEENVSSAALLAEVMKNLERINNNNNATINSSLNETSSAIPSTSHQLTPLKTKMPSKIETKNDLLSNEINDLLLRGESDLGKSKFQLSNDNNENDDDIDDKNVANNTSDYSIPKEGVNIILPGSQLIFNRRKKRCGVDLIDELRKKMNRRLRTNQMYIHKVGLLCWLAHGFHLNKESNDPEVMSIVLSLIPQKSYPKGRVDLKYLEQFTKWFKGLIKIELNKGYRNAGRKNAGENFTIAVTKDSLIKGLTDKKVDNYRELVLLYICALRAIGINCRLVISLCPPDLKPKHDDLFHNQKQNTTKEESSDDDDDEMETEKKNDEKKKKRKKAVIKIDSKIKKKTKVVNDNESESDNESKPIKIIAKNSKQAANIAADEAKKRAAELIRLKYTKKNDNKKKFDHNVSVKSSIEDDNDNKEEKTIKSPVQVRQLRSRTVINSNAKMNLEKNTGASSSGTSKKNKKDDDYDDDGDENDEDEDEVVEKKLRGKGRRKNEKVGEIKKSSRSISKSKRESIIDRRVLSPDIKVENEIKKNIEDKGYYYYIWVEVYVESEENWICVSVPDDKIHCVAEIYKKLPTPVLYIVAFNSLGKLKDVTRRYCSNWLTVTRKQRVDEKWWNETLSQWKEAETAISKAEDESLAQTEMEQPLPKSISECKGHPLYALVRHLLKFEALYPPECVPLGHLKNGEAIYSRHCVHTLRSRETWLKQARVVKPAQEPYKIVKAMPKYDKLSGQMIKDQPLELFGHWQTMAYVPPEAKNGKVPRNEYGNVDLFQECMLPKGTVHIDLPGLFRVAKKLNIDCVAAVVGFNFGGRGAMPMTQGYVVCEEYEDVLREAWEEEQIKAAARAKEKRDKRIWGNWRKLIRGLFIREKITAKYNMTEDNDDDDNDNDDDDDDKKKSTKRTKKNDKKVVKKKKV